jgi:hypothetical protein
MARKAIQFDIQAETDRMRAVMTALCDDGTFWALILKAGESWTRLPDIPGELPEGRWNPQKKRSELYREALGMGPGGAAARVEIGVKP